MIIYNHSTGDRELHGAPLLVLANKQDAPGAIGAVELKERLGIGKYDTRVCAVKTCSALNGDGLKAAIDWAILNSKKSQRAELIRRRV